MKRLILFLVGFAFVASAAEYGHFSRTETTSNWSHSVILNEGDRFIFLGSDVYTASYAREEAVSFSITYTNQVINKEIKSYRQVAYSGEIYAYSLSENHLTITGPCSIIPNPSNNDRIVDYKIVRAYEENESSKYNASLNSDGSRLAIALKQAGSNAVTRVYEFDGSSWNQLGDDVE